MIKRIAKWHCGICGERFVWADVDPTEEEWIMTIRGIMANHWYKYHDSGETASVPEKVD